MHIRLPGKRYPVSGHGTRPSKYPWCVFFIIIPFPILSLFQSNEYFSQWTNCDLVIYPEIIRCHSNRNIVSTLSIRLILHSGRQYHWFVFHFYPPFSWIIQFNFCSLMFNDVLLHSFFILFSTFTFFFIFIFFILQSFSVSMFRPSVHPSKTITTFFQRSGQTRTGPNIVLPYSFCLFIYFNL